MLKALRFFERLFYDIGSWFENWADSVDKSFYNEPIHIKQVKAEYGIRSIRPEFPIVYDEE